MGRYEEVAAQTFAPRSRQENDTGCDAVVRGDGGSGLSAIQGGNANYLGGQTGVWWHLRWVFEAADAGMNEIDVDSVLRYAGAGDHQQQGSPGFHRVRLAAFTPFLGSAGSPRRAQRAASAPPRGCLEARRLPG
jgi:hypothetical protein